MKVRKRIAYSATELAHLWGVSRITTSRWFRIGALKGYRLPFGKKSYRATIANVMRFAQENNLPLPPEAENESERVPADSPV